MNQINSRDHFFCRLLTATFLLAVFFSAAPIQPAAAAGGSGSFLVKLRGGDAGVLKNLGTDIKRQFGFSRDPSFNNIYSLQSALSLDELRSRLAERADYVQISGKFSASDQAYAYAPSFSAQSITVNDPGFTANPLNIDKQWAIPAVGFDYAWSKTTGSAANVVAVVDTGIDATHEDLRDLHLIDGYDFINRQPITGRVNSDDNGHGTLVAGVLGASANNGIGIVGTNWLISIMPLKALDSGGKGDSASVAQAIVWASDHGADFINLSLGGIGLAHDTVLANAISYAFNRGALLVAAAGNDGAKTGGNLDQEPVYPVCEDNGANQVLGVAAVDQNGIKPEFSNYGGSCIDIVAPGKRILSTINHDPLTGAYAPNSYAYASGTSLAAPFVLGEAALLKALHPQASNVQIRDLILSTASPVDNLNLSQCAGQSCRGLLGAGEINARAAVDRDIPVTLIKDGDLITLSPNSQIYQVVGNQKRPVSVFVLQQKFPETLPKLASAAQLAAFADGPYVTPLDGTLVKTSSSLTVYMVERGQKMPITGKIFSQRQLDFGKVITLADSEANTWLTGSLLPPAEGAMVRTARDLTVYWVVGEALHPVNYNFYLQRGLNVFPLLIVSRSDLAGFPRGEAYVR